MSRLTDLKSLGAGPWGSKDNPLWNPNVVTIAAGTNTVEWPYNATDAGTAAMVTLTPPYTDFAGEVAYVPGGAFTWTAAGNISVLGTAVANRTLKFLYSPYAAKGWSPSYV